MILACIINEAFFCTFLWHHLFRSSLAQLASFPRFSLFVFLNQILFDLVCIQFVFGFPTDLSEALCCLATLCKRGVLLVTFFVLDWSRPLRCRSAGLMLVIGRLDFVFFWWKQHLICTDQNVSATCVRRTLIKCFCRVKTFSLYLNMWHTTHIWSVFVSQTSCL